MEEKIINEIPINCENEKTLRDKFFKEFKDEQRAKVNSYQKQRYDNDIDKRREYQRNYYHEKGNELQKKYYDRNRDIVLNKQKAYYQKNKDRIKAQYVNKKINKQAEQEKLQCELQKELFEAIGISKYPCSITFKKGDVVICEHNSESKFGDLFGNDFDNFKEFLEKLCDNCDNENVKNIVNKFKC